MPRRQIPQRGNVYWIDPNPVSGRELKNRHPFVVITPRPINQLGVCMTVPITTGGGMVRGAGLAVPILGHQTTGVAVCNQIRTFDIEERVAAGTARYVERLDEITMTDIVSRVVSAVEATE